MNLGMRLTVQFLIITVCKTYVIKLSVAGKGMETRRIKQCSHAHDMAHDMPQCCFIVDREIFAVRNFSPVA